MAALHSHVHAHTHTPDTLKQSKQSILHFSRKSQREQKKQGTKSRAASVQVNNVQIRVWVFYLCVLQCVCVCVCVSSQAEHMTAAAPSLPRLKLVPLLVVGERSHGVAFLSVWERASKRACITLSKRGWEKGSGGSWAENTGGHRRSGAGQVEDEEHRACRSVGLVYVCVFACVCVHVPRWTTKQETLVTLHCFINTAVCLVWADPRDRHTDRRTDRHIYIIYSCQHLYLRDKEHKQTAEPWTDYFTKHATKTAVAAESWAQSDILRHSSVWSKDPGMVSFLLYENKGLSEEMFISQIDGYDWK